MASKAPPVTEDRRIIFKQQLLHFREDNNNSELAFPSNLTNIERKYLHRVATELGLESSSSGSGQNRFITVKRKNKLSSGEESKISSINWQFSEASIKQLDSLNTKEIKDILRKHNYSPKANHSSVASSLNPRKKIDLTKREYSYRSAETRRKNKAEQKNIQSLRSKLPASNYREAVCNLVRSNQIVLINGETGCGKSTQVPQFLYGDDQIGPHCKIVITQPRRISAVSLAERIAYERSETVGDTVGYNIRLESVQSSTTQMLFVTPGVLLRKLIDDPQLHEFTHIIIDEAHERDRFTEFLLILLRDLSVKRPNIRIVLMSATMHIMKLTNYFGEIPTLSIGSSVFPVQEYHLEHILKFTNYFQVGRNSNQIGTHSQNAHLGVSYTCSFCNKGGMLSPEEFGTHAAMCFPKENRNIISPTHTHQIKLQELQYKLQQIQNKFSSSALSFENLPQIISTSVNSEHIAEELEDENSDTDSDYDYDFRMNHNAPDLLEEGEGSKELIYSEEQEELNQLLQQYTLAQKNQTDDQQIDYDLIILLLNYIVRSEYSIITNADENSHELLNGSILIFLPGWDDIMKLQKLLISHQEFCDDQKYLILQLHSNIPKKDQQLVFQKCSIPGQRKIILSTNIAETSLTIDDVTVVINSGRIKEKVYDPHLKLSYLKSTYVSKASANQRRGRAGRTQSGVCFHLYSKLRDKHLSSYAESELLRMPLEELVLQAKKLGVAPGKGNEPDSVVSFLSKSLDPPHQLSILQGIQLLQSLGCLTEDEDLTVLGDFISVLPMNPRIGKMLFVAPLLGSGGASVTLASILSYRDPFLLPTNDHQRTAILQIKSNICNQTFSNNLASDPLITFQMCQLYSQSMKAVYAKRKFCEDYQISFSTMNYLVDHQKQILFQLQEECGYSNSNNLFNRHNSLLPLQLSLITLASYPNIAVRYKDEKLFLTEKGLKLKLHSSSVLSKFPPYNKKYGVKDIEIVAYQELIALNPHAEDFLIGGASYLMSNASPVSLFALLLLCGNVEVVSSDEPSVITVKVDNWLYASIPATQYVLLQDLRIILQSILNCFIVELQNNLNGDSTERRSNSVVSDGQITKFLEVLSGVIGNEQLSAVKFSN